MSSRTLWHRWRVRLGPRLECYYCPQRFRSWWKLIQHQDANHADELKHDTWGVTMYPRKLCPPNDCRCEAHPERCDILATGSWATWPRIEAW